MFCVESYFDLSHTIAASLFEGKQYPWDVLPEIGDFIMRTGPMLDSAVYEQRGENIWIARSSTIFSSAYIAGPCIICPEAEIRHCAFLRGKTIVGAGAVVGNSTELKNVILFDGVQVPHYNYVGDSVLGYKAHMGAGAITSNVKSDRKETAVRYDGGAICTGMKKFGAIIGDNVEVGCGSVLNPATVVGRNSQIYPLSMVRGCIPADSIYKRAGEVVNREYDL